MQRKINSAKKKKKITLSNTLYTISEFNTSVDLHIGTEISNADKDSILMFSAIVSLQRLVNITNWGGC